MNIETQKAISRLAGLFDNGELQACSDPTAFLHQVADEVESLRALLKRAWMQLEASNGGSEAFRAEVRAALERQQ
jgi:hypothetical protein